MAPKKICPASPGLARATSVVVLVALLFTSPATLPAQASKDTVPRGVSPGSPVTAEKLAGSCPTFSWSGVPEVSSYELVLYEVSERGVLETLLQTRVPGDARSWTPSASHCPASDSQYAWAARALTEDGPGAWSELLLFATAGVPTEDELRQALGTLRRYRQGREARLADATTSDTAVQRAPAGSAAGDFLPRPLTAPTITGTTRVAAAESTPVLGPASLSVSNQIHLGAASDLFKDGAVFLWDDFPTGNTSLGRAALASVAGNATGNTAVGREALRNTTGGMVSFDGSDNTAVGYRALLSNDTGQLNTASGAHALSSNTIGTVDTASGARALFKNISGSGNTASGALALYDNTTGNQNTALGSSAGRLNVDGNDSIFIKNLGAATDDKTIKIGTQGTQLTTFIAGIRGATTLNDNAIPVLIDSDGQLGTTSSSGALKRDIQDLGAHAERLLDLRPVAFRFEQHVDANPETPLQFGLIAEEVAEVFPELVVNDDQGKPYTVRYHLLAPLLLAEIQLQDEELGKQDQEIADLRRQMVDRDRVVAELQRRLERLAKKKRFRP